MRGLPISRFPFEGLTIVVHFSFVVAGIGEHDTNLSIAYITTGYLTIILYSFALFGLLRLFEQISNPLGTAPCDFPGKHYMHQLGKALNGTRTKSLDLLQKRSASPTSTNIYSLLANDIRVEDAIDN
jgi:predicted membrane chloride channel (bestrophin family)